MTNFNSQSQETLSKMPKLGDKIKARRKGKILEPNPAELIRQMREKRSLELMLPLFSYLLTLTPNSELQTPNSR